MGKSGKTNELRRDWGKVKARWGRILHACEGILRAQRGAIARGGRKSGQAPNIFF